jgi:hypothetical protein
MRLKHLDICVNIFVQFIISLSLSSSLLSRLRVLGDICPLICNVRLSLSLAIT